MVEHGTAVPNRLPENEMITWGGFLDYISHYMMIYQPVHGWVRGAGVCGIGYRIGNVSTSTQCC